MSTAKSIAGIVPGLQATALVGANLKTMDYYLQTRKGKKKKGMGRMVKMGVGNLIAIPLIGVSSQMINEL
jgi:hypothetical protein